MSLLRFDPVHPDFEQLETLVIAIDGPAGAGKSTVAIKLAQALGFEFLDTGAMYRCVTLAAIRAGVQLSDHHSVFELAKGLKIELGRATVSLNGEDVSEAIRSPDVTSLIQSVADNIQVRELLSKWQREWSHGKRVVTEGRDQGSEVFYDSPCKIFLVASSEERARRRQEELAGKGTHVSLETILAQQNARDLQDATRPVGALRKAEDAIEFSTDGLSLEQVCENLIHLIRQKLELPLVNLRISTPKVQRQES
ncbi:MAG: (d)CMP kinase [Planctomycetales bacterium]|nr:(d)CMP kinase [Planctomycetales bacterium]